MEHPSELGHQTTRLVRQALTNEMPQCRQAGLTPGRGRGARNSQIVGDLAPSTATRKAPQMADSIRTARAVSSCSPYDAEAPTGGLAHFCLAWLQSAASRTRDARCGRPEQASGPGGEDARLSKEQRASRPGSRAGRCSYSSIPAASGRSNQCAKTAPLLRSRSLTLRSCSSSGAGACGEPWVTPALVGERKPRLSVGGCSCGTGIKRRTRPTGVPVTGLAAEDVAAADQHGPVLRPRRNLRVVRVQRRLLHRLGGRLGQPVERGDHLGVVPVAPDGDRDQHEPANQSRVLDRGPQRHLAAQRVAEQVDRVEPEVRGHLRDVVGHRRRPQRPVDVRVAHARTTR